MVKVVNKTRGKTLGKHVELKKSFLERARGLMLTKRKNAILDCRRDDIPASTIHMMLMKYPIDAIWVNNEMKVVDLKEQIPAVNPMKPNTWKMYKPKEKARYVIELGKGKLGTTQLGDEIEFI